MSDLPELVRPQPDDLEFEAVVIKDVQKTGDSYTMTRDDGWSFAFDAGPIEPAAGMTALFYGPGIGFTVRGLVIDGHTFFYRSAEEEEQRHAEWVANLERERLETYGRTKDDMQARLEAYPEVFRKRIERFLQNAPETAWKHQGYEMAVCDAALRIIAVYKSGEELRAWADSDYRPQLVDVEDLGLSGNQWDMAKRLAMWWYRKRENVWKDHAAISFLVGCEEAGCVPVDEGAVA